MSEGSARESAAAPTMSGVDGVVRAAEAARDANEGLRSAVAAAHAENVSISQLAAAAQVTRQTIYRWLAEAAAPPSRR